MQLHDSIHLSNSISNIAKTKMFVVSQLTAILCAILSNSKSSFKSNQNKQYGAYSNNFHSLDWHLLGFKGNSTLRTHSSSITN